MRMHGRLRSSAFVGAAVAAFGSPDSFLPISKVLLHVGALLIAAAPTY